MGLAVSCQWFEGLSNELHWVLEQKFGAKGVVHILDDVLFIGPPNTEHCYQTLNNFLSLCQTIGIPIKHSKTVQSCFSLTFLGIDLDTVLMEARLPADKLAKIRLLLNSYLSRSKLSLVKIQSLVGLLNFACIVVVPGRCFLRRLIEITRGLRKPHHRVRVTTSAKADMQM